MTAPRLSSIEPFEDADTGPAVRGYLHRPAGPTTRGIVLTHGAGSDCEAPILLAMAGALAAAGFTVLRCDLPFRQARPSGPPSPATAARDRLGLRRAVNALRSMGAGRVSIGGHSYGGRQASLLAADEPDLVEGLLLLSYPLHPPRRPAQWRTEHFAALRAPALFVHGTRDPFGSIRELDEARRLIAGPSACIAVEGAGHDLARGGVGVPLPAVVETFRRLLPR